VISTTFRVSAINANGDVGMNDFTGDDAHTRAKAMFDANVQSGKWIAAAIQSRVVAFAGGECKDTGFVSVETFAA
jgi:hypothetical protein